MVPAASLLNDGLVESAGDSTTTTTTTTVDIWISGTWQCHTLVDTCARCWSITKKSSSSSSSSSKSFSLLPSSSCELVQKLDWLKTQFYLQALIISRVLYLPWSMNNQFFFPPITSTCLAHHLACQNCTPQPPLLLFLFFSLLSAVVHPTRAVLCLLFCSKCVITMYSSCSYC